MKFELVSLDGVKYSAEAYSVTLKTAAGEITVLPDHEPLLGAVVPGIITIRRKQSDSEAQAEHYATYGGVLEVGKHGIRVLVDEATHGDEINESEAEKAHQAAIEMQKNAKNQVELEKAQALVERTAVRLGVANLRRRHHRR